MSFSDSDKAKLAALHEALKQRLAEREQYPTRCPNCDSPLLAAWREGQVDKGEPFFFCGPCLERERAEP